MFNDFESFAAIQNALRAPFAMPIICLQLSACALMATFKKFALTALHVATLSPINAYGSFKDVLVSLLVSAWVALRGIFDAIRSTIVLITRSISTVILMEFVGVSTLALGVLKAGEAMGSAVKGVVNYFKSPKVPAQPEDIDASTNLDGAACGA